MGEVIGWVAGYIKDHRKELDSDIWAMPPLYHRVWQYLKYRANHDEATLPLKDGSFLTIRPGQFLTSIRTIAKGVGWMERGKFFEPNKKSISTILSWLKEKEMIDFRAVTSNGGKVVTGNGLEPPESNGSKSDESNAFGTLITLENWAFYQLSENKSNGFSDEESNGSKAVTGNGSEPLPGDITIINNKKIAATAGAHARDSSNLQNESQEILRTPHAQVEEAYLMLHCRHFSGKDWDTLSKLFETGIPHTKIISFMRDIHAARSQNSKINSFTYYDQSIREEWEKEQAKVQAAKTAAPDPSQTTPAPTGTVAKGQAPSFQPNLYVLDEDDPITQLMRKADQAYAQHGTS
jgi:hypothetical protein